MDEKYFRTVYLEEARTFLIGLRPKIKKKLLDKIDDAEQQKDSHLLKKLNSEIWEFRMRYGFIQIRLLAFWDKSDKENTLVGATHGFIKKTDRVPCNEIKRAIN